jgi:hypothetical protein
MSERARISVAEFDEFVASTLPMIVVAWGVRQWK